MVDSFLTRWLFSYLSGP